MHSIGDKRGKLDKHVLGVFYNDVRINIIKCLNDIARQHGIQIQKNNIHILDVFNSLALTGKHVSPEYQADLIKSLRYRFPFINVLTDISNAELALPGHFQKIFSRIFSLLDSLRNSLVHPTDQEFFIDYILQKNIYFDLGKLYESARRMVQQHYQLDSQKLTPILLFDGKGKQKNISQFHLALCQSHAINKTKQANPVHRIIHDFGHVFICSLFLNKNQINNFIDAFWQSGCKEIDDEQKVILKELISVHRLRLPVERFHETKSHATITLEALSELSRCPRQLFDSLSVVDQQKFHAGNSPLSLEKYGAEQSNNENSFLMVRSHKNRFIPMMMKFLDEDEKCKLRFAIDLGQFYYNVRLKPARSFTDKNSRIRQLGQKLVSYARLKDIEALQKNKPTAWSQLEDNHQSVIEEEQKTHQNTSPEIKQLKPYIAKAYPRYHYYSDKIGFRLKLEGEEESYPDWSLQQAQSKSPLKPIKGKDLQPHFWISPPQMSYLVFYQFLQSQAINKQFLSLENVLQKYQTGMHRLLKQLKENEIADFEKQDIQSWLDKHIFRNKQNTEFVIKLSDLPRVVINHLKKVKQKKYEVAEIRKRVKYILEETNQRKVDIENQLKEIRKRGEQGYRPIKASSIADFLINDLMRFQPINLKKPHDGGKINSQQYQILKNSITYYGAYIKQAPEMLDLFKGAGLLESDHQHAFLYKLELQNKPDKYSGLISFYEAYLQARKVFLEKYLNRLENKKYVDDTLPKWLRIRQSSTMKSWLDGQLDESNQLKQALPVPKNLFYSGILSMVSNVIGVTEKELHEQGSKTFIRNGEPFISRPAINWLIKQYLTEGNDQLQSMYEYPRSHQLFNDFKDRRNMESKDKFLPKKNYFLTEQQRKDCLPQIREKMTNLSEEEELQKIKWQLQSYKQSERINRHYAEQDILLYLLTKQYLDADVLKLGAKNPTWSLGSIDKTLLDTRIPYELTVPSIQDRKKSLKHLGCKVKNLGDLRMLVRDSRLPSLLIHYQEDVINQQEIRVELMEYDRNKLKIMALAHRLEKQITQNLGGIHEIRKIKNNILNDDSSYLSHKDYLSALFQSRLKKVTAKQIVQASQIRNAFVKNEYPKINEFPEIYKMVRLQKTPKDPKNNRKVSQLYLNKLIELHNIMFKEIYSEHSQAEPLKQSEIC